MKCLFKPLAFYFIRKQIILGGVFFLKNKIVFLQNKPLILILSPLPFLLPFTLTYIITNHQ